MSEDDSKISKNLIALNRSIPFVRAVFDVIAGNEDIKTAAQLLRKESNTYGLYIVYDEDDEYYALHGEQLVPKNKDLNAIKMLTLARKNWDAFEKNYISANATDCKRFQIKLNQFLDATSLVLQGTDFTNSCIVTLDDGSIWTFSQRVWGKYLSEWANQNQWMQQFGSFDYVDFTFYCDRVIQDYMKWQEVAFAAIKQKCTT